MTNDDSKVFHVGLCLAGAVSAGAYTAGVMDYLIQALEDWESKRGQPGVPSHRVKIPVIGGASAGGMTGIVTASTINNPIPPVSIAPADFSQPITQNKFYHTWVDLTHDDMFPLLLETSDIKTEQIYSLLNSSFIDEIAQRVIQVDNTNWIQRKYIDDHLKVFTTLSNLQGLPFDISFNSNAPGVSKYIVWHHNDYACFGLNRAANDYAHDGWIPLDFRNNVNGQLASQAAMATGAFPLGLRARGIKRNSDYVNDNQWLRKITKDNPVLPPTYQSINVDGGLINNEPFEKVRDVLSDITQQKDPATYNDYNQFKSTVLMVDPFPSEASNFDSSDKLSTVISNTLSAMVSQCRVKSTDLEQAMDSTKAGQFLIAPVRTVLQKDGTSKKEQGSKAIACGSLHGFGGFLHKEFRLHDYFLGRANCEKFLRDHFAVPATSTNSITEGYAHLSEDERKKFYSQVYEHPELPIIPILTPRQPHKYLPRFSSGSDWPVRDIKDIERFRNGVEKRAQSILMNAADYSTVTKALLWIGAKVVLNRKLADGAMGIIKKSLEEHQLVK